jgi:hypothetical protein
MKKLFIFFLLLIAVFTSCKKNELDSIPLGTIKAKIDGVETTFNVNAKATHLVVQNGYGVQISGLKKNPSSSGTRFELVIVSPQQFNTGVYVKNVNDSPLVEAAYFYDFFFGAGSTYSATNNTTNPATITITEWSASAIKGSFHGELKGYDLSQNTISTVVSNGVFYVSF